MSNGQVSSESKYIEIPVNQLLLFGTIKYQNWSYLNSIQDAPLGLLVHQ